MCPPARPSVAFVLPVLLKRGECCGICVSLGSTVNQQFAGPHGPGVWDQRHRGPKRELIELPPRKPPADGRLHLVFHGHPGEDRNLDDLIKAMTLVDDRFVLHLMLVSGTEPGGFWRRLAAEAPAGRIIFEEPVSPRQTVRRLVSWDIGFNILEPLNYNHRHALPNKFFDYIHAGLATVCSNTVTGKDFVDTHGIGWVLPEITPQSLAALLNSLTPAEINERKAAALQLREQIHARGEESRMVGHGEQNTARRMTGGLT